METVSIEATDDRGEYCIFNLKPGEYYVKAAETSEPVGFSGPTDIGSDWMLLQELGSQYAPLYYPGVVQIDQAQTITLRAGEEMQADFAMRRVKLVEVDGRVSVPDGSPASHVFVQLWQSGVGGWGELGASADSQGEFSIKGVLPGSYIIIDFCINNVTMELLLRLRVNGYAQAQRERRSAGRPAQTRFGVVGPRFLLT